MRDQPSGGARGAESYWHFDKRVPIAIVSALLLQSGSVFWWAGRIDKRVENLEAAIASEAQLIERVVRVEMVSKGNAVTLERVEAKLDRFIVGQSD